MPLDAAEDQIGIGGPCEWFGVGVAFIQIRLDGVFQRQGASMHAASQVFFG